MVDTWTCNMIMWYWSDDTLFGQLSIDHNMYVQYQIAGSHTCQKVWHLINIGRMDRGTVMWLPKFIGWIDNEIVILKGPWSCMQQLHYKRWVRYASPPSTTPSRARHWQVYWHLSSQMKAQYFQCVDTNFDFKSSFKCTGKASLTHPQHIKSEWNLTLPLPL